MKTRNEEPASLVLSEEEDDDEGEDHSELMAMP